MITLQKPHHYMKYLVYHIPWCRVYVANASPRAAATAPGAPPGPAHALSLDDGARGRGWPARDFDLGGGFHYSGSYPMVFLQHSAGGDRAPRASVVFIVGLTRVELQWRVGSFQLQALNTIGFLNPLTSCGPAAARQSSAVRAVSPSVPCAPTAVRRVDGHF